MAGLCRHPVPGLLALPVVFGGFVCPQGCSGVVEDLLGEWGRGHLGGEMGMSCWEGNWDLQEILGWLLGGGDTLPGQTMHWDDVAKAEKFFWCCCKGLEPGKLGMGAIWIPKLLAVATSPVFVTFLIMVPTLVVVASPVMVASLMAGWILPRCLRLGMMLGAAWDHPQLWGLMVCPPHQLTGQCVVSTGPWLCWTM